jgi:CheY-like chemotaxis protein
MYKVLQIEDVPSDAYLVRREVKKILEPCDFLVVEDMESFLSALLEFKPDLIISDLSIPGFDLLSAFSLMVKHDLPAPFIVVTGSKNEEVIRSCMAAGVTEFISKDDIHRLGPAILKVLK